MSSQFGGLGDVLVATSASATACFGFGNFETTWGWFASLLSRQGRLSPRARQQFCSRYPSQMQTLNFRLQRHSARLPVTPTAMAPAREGVLYRQPTGPNPLNQLDKCSGAGASLLPHGGRGHLVYPNDRVIRQLNEIQIAG